MVESDKVNTEVQTHRHTNTDGIVKWGQRAIERVYSGKSCEEHEHLTKQYSTKYNPKYIIYTNMIYIFIYIIYKQIYKIYTHKLEITVTNNSVNK